MRACRIGRSLPALPPNQIPDDTTPLIPYYEQIRQFGLDAQLTVGSWLYKLEAIQRSGARNLLGLEEDYRALSVELKRRLTDNWSLRLEVIANLSVDPQDISYGARRDGFVALNLNYNC